MGNTSQIPPSSQYNSNYASHQYHKSQSTDMSQFNANQYIRQDLLAKNCSDGITSQDVINIRQAFENLRDENDKYNEIKLSKLRAFPFFNKSDLSRFPVESERIQNQARDSDYRLGEQDNFSKRYPNYVDSQNDQNDPTSLRSPNIYQSSKAQKIKASTANQLCVEVVVILDSKTSKQKESENEK